MKSARSVLLFIILFLVSATVFGNGDSKLISWRGKPLPIRFFHITEFGYSVRLAQNDAPRYGGNRDFHLQWEYGVMKNVRLNWALGITGYYSADDDGSRIAVKLRGRRWLERNTSIDFGAGPVVRTLSSLIDNAPGLVAGISLNQSDLVSATIILELIPWKEPILTGGFTGPPAYRKGTETTLYTGFKFGSYPGTLLGVAVPLVILIDFLTQGSD